MRSTASNCKRLQGAADAMLPGSSRLPPPYSPQGGGSFVQVLLVSARGYLLKKSLLQFSNQTTLLFCSIITLKVAIQLNVRNGQKPSCRNYSLMPQLIVTGKIVNLVTSHFTSPLTVKFLYQPKIRENTMRIKALLVGITLALFIWPALAMADILVEAEWLKDNLNAKNLRIVDVSNKADTYGKGHIPGAVKVNRNLDLSTLEIVPPHRYPTKAQTEKLMSRLGIDNNTTVVAYDDSLSLFASRLLVIMELYGHDKNKLKLLNGGSVRWQKLGYPMTTDTPAITATNYTAKAVLQGMFISWSDMYRDVVLGARPEIKLLDSRPAKEYSGENIRALRGGHIPKSINVTGANAVNPEDQRFKPLDEIRKMYVDAGFTPDKIIYEYCHSGDRSAHAYIILKHLLGYEKVYVNDGGWLEWANTLSLPAEGEIWKWEVPKEAKK